VEEPGLRNKDPDSDQGVAHSSTSRSGPRRPKLTIWVMAMHAAKGLEFDEVILPFWSKGTSMDLEDERKIAFMSLTRAKRRVMISYSKTKWSPGIQRETTGASLFVDKLLHIPGLRVTHEVFEPRISAFNTYSSQQQQQHQQQIAYNKRLTSYSDSNRDTCSILDSSDRSRQGRSGTANDSGIQLSKYNPPRAPPNSRDIGTACSVSSNPSNGRARRAQKSTNGLREEESVDGVHPLLKYNLKILVTSMKSSSEIHQPQPIITTSAVDAIVVDNVAQAVAKKSKRSRGDVSLAAFPNASKVTVEKITELLNEKTHTQLALRFYLRDVIKYQLNIVKGAIPVADGDKLKALSVCTAKELAEYIRISLIKKNGT
jgi:UvrD-like helicase C-terminal domain